MANKAGHDATQAAWNAAAALYAGTFPEPVDYIPMLQRFLAVLPPKATLLDAGCGPGTLTRYFQLSRGDLKLIAMDYAPEMLREAAKVCPDVRFEWMDLRSFHWAETPFDGISLGFVVPYLDPVSLRRLLVALTASTKDVACMYLSWIEGDPKRSGTVQSSDGKLEMQVYYYRGEGIAKTLELLGWECLYRELVVQEHMRESQRVQGLLVAQKKNRPTSP